MLRTRWLAAGGALLASLALAACGGDDTEENGGEESADVARYCELTAELDRAGAETFRDLEEDPDASPEDFEQAEAEFVREHEDELNEVQSVAPSEIEDDVEVLVASTRGRAGLEDNPPDDQEVQAAEQNVQQFERENCDRAADEQE